MIVLDIDTPGGRVDSAFAITDSIIGSSVTDGGSGEERVQRWRGDRHERGATRDGSRVGNRRGTADHGFRAGARG
ncbi:MAG: hypothetical protein HC933_07315 [Pleurocapsa sp. SU_196_0]|nr:hypothetical protein [Pleurocapsa sp. SU_196_0]